jgi:WhiB family transcriptional regulator, redox-sensing transcriptional regulator
MCDLTLVEGFLAAVRYRREERGRGLSSQRVEELWQHRAACKGPQAAVFFPPSQVERKDEREMREARAKEICAKCPVRRPCLDYALAIREPHGIWGGLNELERKQLIARAG